MNKLCFVAAMFVVGSLASVGAQAKSPTGVGELQLGMAQSAVEALNSASSTYPVTPLTPYVYKDGSKPKPGEESYDVKLHLPFSQEPLKGVLTFKSGKLIGIYVNLSATISYLDVVKSEIASKYGRPKVDDSMQERQCVYRNGANFKLPHGSTSYTWSGTMENGEHVEVIATRFTISMCPFDLRYGGAEPTNVDSLTISLIHTESTSTSNPF